MTSPTLQKILACVAASALLFTGAAVMAAPLAQTRQTTAQTQWTRTTTFPVPCLNAGADDRVAFKAPVLAGAF